MLSGESNENGEKTIIGLISKKQLSTCSTPFFFFLHISLPLFCTFSGGNVVPVNKFLFTCFFTAAHFHHFLNAAKKFSCWSSKK